MMKLDSHGNFEPWIQPEYGCDAEDKKVKPPRGHKIIKFGDILKKGDRPFDVYSGWLTSDFWNSMYHYFARSNGRWTTWARLTA